MPDERGFSVEDGLSAGAESHARSRIQGTWREDAYAVVIGINTYHDPKIPDLGFARADAEAIYAVLTDPDVGHFKPENVTLLVDAEATERNIRSALGTNLPKRATAESTVCIYFAGHGAPVVDPRPGRKSADGIEKYLVPHDAVADDLRSSGISMEAVQQYFSYLDANQVICFLDCCYSGGAGGRSFERDDFRARALLSDEFLDSLASEGRLVVTSCATNEVSLESRDIGHGIFTHHLVAGLRGAADTDGNGLVTIDELYDYLYRHVERDARSLGGSMRPVRKGSVQGRVYLTAYETPAQKQIRQGNQQAAAFWAGGQVDEAERAWTAVLALNPTHEAATNGLARVAERRAQEQAARDDAARVRAEALDRKHRVLLAFFERDALSASEYEQALRLLDAEPDALVALDRRRRRVLDGLVAGELTPKTYRQSLAALERAPAPEVAPLTVLPPPAPVEPKSEVPPASRPAMPPSAVPSELTVQSPDAPPEQGPPVDPRLRWLRDHPRALLAGAAVAVLALVAISRWPAPSPRPAEQAIIDAPSPVPAGPAQASNSEPAGTGARPDPPTETAAPSEQPVSNPRSTVPAAPAQASVMEQLVVDARPVPKTKTTAPAEPPIGNARSPVPAAPAQASNSESAGASARPDPTTENGRAAWNLPDDPLWGFVEIPGGQFTMGSRDWKDSFVHTVKLPPYYIGRYEVTVGQYTTCVRDGGCAPADQRALAGPADRPVRWVTWYEALAYCDWLNKKLKGASTTPKPLADRLANGWQITLPSEAEWERAARGTDGRLHPWGEAKADPTRANYLDTGNKRVVAVGSFPAGRTPDGIFDMAGNVAEWTRSVYKEYPYDNVIERERLDRPREDMRVLRGGWWDQTEVYMEAAYRRWAFPFYFTGTIGFRLAFSRLGL